MGLSHFSDLSHLVQQPEVAMEAGVIGRPRAHIIQEDPAAVVVIVFHDGHQKLVPLLTFGVLSVGTIWVNED